MKFSNVIAISLSLGCQVLAAPAVPTHTPTPTPTPASGVEALVADAPALSTPTPVSDVEALAADAPALSTPTPVTDVEDVAADAPAARSLPAGVPDIPVIKAAVSELRNSVSGELSKITSMSASGAPSYDIPVIKKSLANIATLMKAATTGMAPALVRSTAALTAEEAQALQCALNEIEAIVYDIKLALSSLLSIIGADVRELIAPEIETIHELAIPLVAPLIGFVYSILGLVPGGAAVTNKLTTVAHSVIGVAGALKTLLAH